MGAAWWDCHVSAHLPLLPSQSKILHGSTYTAVCRAKLLHASGKYMEVTCIDVQVRHTTVGTISKSVGGNPWWFSGHLHVVAHRIKAAC